MIIGRKKELELLEEAFNVPKAQFITVYGRRRVGKTFLIREFYRKRNCTFFHTTGIQHGTLKDQLAVFTRALSETFFQNQPIKEPASWAEAFERLHNLILTTKGEVVVFLDELPWMATRKSGLLSILDLYWNKYWVAMPQLTLVVCGSSASWIIAKIIEDRGGFYNRTTLRIHLQPFSLSETREYLAHRRILLSDKQILSLYMAIGGIPYYLDYVRPKKTVQQTVQAFFFEDNSPFRNEFDLLFESLFNGSDSYKEIVKVVALKQEGMTRAEIERMTKLSSSGGYLSKRLNDLCRSGFLQEFSAWGKQYSEYYKVVDEFCLFYLRWVQPFRRDSFAEDHWIMQSKLPTYRAWAGYAFESVCRKHIRPIVRALGVRPSAPMSSWRYIPRKKGEIGAQIDLVIERFDDAITLLEMKYTDRPFTIDKSYASVLTRKMAVFREQTKTEKALYTSLVAANGIKKTIYSEELVSSVVTAEDLFSPQS